MPKAYPIIFFFTLSSFLQRVCSQPVGDSVSRDMLEKTVAYLASDRLKGRVNYSPEQLEAADYLAKEFRAYGLETFEGYADFLMPFHLTPGTDRDSSKLIWNGRELNSNHFYFASPKKRKTRKELSDFMVLRADLPLADSLLYYGWESRENLLLWINLPPGSDFLEATRNVIMPAGLPGADILIVATAEEPKELLFVGTPSNKEPPLFNIVGCLPGKSRPGELLIFSAHYDHIDISQSGKSGEVFNGANDDASGTAAVLALARYYALRNDNEITLLFCLFAGEELGLYGSAAFANTLSADSVIANINIEMIGRTNYTGKNAFLVTGSRHSDLSDILSRNLKGSGIKVLPQLVDPNSLFQRSDNFSFYQKNIPAHSIMCSDDSEPCYHQPCDDAGRLDYDNMQKIIRAIARGVETMVNGSERPRLK